MLNIYVVVVVVVVGSGIGTALQAAVPGAMHRDPAMVLSQIWVAAQV